MAAEHAPPVADEALGMTELNRAPGQIVDRVRVAGKHIAITRNRAPVVVVVPYEWWQEAVKVTPRRTAP